MRTKACNICEIERLNRMYHVKLLTKKYYQPQVDSHDFRNLNDIIFGMKFNYPTLDEYSKNYFLYEVMVNDRSQEFLDKYNQWNQIVKSIKNVILERC